MKIILLVSSIIAMQSFELPFCSLTKKRMIGFNLFPESSSTEIPGVEYAKDNRKSITINRQSFVGEYEIEEREDRDTSKTLIELLDNGHILLSKTDGIPTQSAYGQWEYISESLVFKLHRQYEGYATDRVFLGDVISLDRIPPIIEGQIKCAEDSITSDEEIQYDFAPHLAHPDDAIGYFTAVRITAPSAAA
uniref:Uncharacterized protein n=1 Tax=Aureoumbra lagunensis TaxID=44058 RepID=A0A7S3NL05_9STRA|mmetsp:Transcript_8712/g.12080  ORF Transcript_8712/g.12080 Transcript_8712/m.12080 type:complete len:192 (-) Transcript_8712:406-981(-)